MKRIITYLTFTLFLFIPFQVFAFSRLKASNQSPIVGEEIKIYLEIDYGHDLRIREAHYRLKYDTNKFEYAGIIWGQSLGQEDISIPGEIHIDKPDDGSLWEYGDVAVVKLIVKESGKTKIELDTNGQTGYFESGNAMVQSCTGVSFNLKQPDTLTSLGTLYVDGYILNPIFKDSIYEYKVIVPPNVEKVNVVAKPQNSNQTVTGAGERKLQYGDNLVKVTVKAQNGDTAVYRVMITREDNRNSDVNLSYLEITNTEIRYEEGVYEYNTEVSKSIDKVFITARAKDEKALITGMGEKQLEFGKNTFEIKVESSKGVTQIYTFNITRTDIEFQSSNRGANLLSLKIEDRKLNVLEYDKFLYTVYDEKRQVTVEAIPQSITAKAVVTGQDKLVLGPNEITITVTETDGQMKEYKIYVYKLPTTSKLANSLTINYDPNTENILYISKASADNQIIPSKFVKSMRSKDFTLHYAYTENEDEIKYLLKFDKTAPEKDINTSITRLEEKALPTYYMELPAGTDVTLYVGDIYPSNSIVRIYSYETEGMYRVVTAGVAVNAGYVNFKPNDQTYYVITTDQLVLYKRTYRDIIEENKETIAYCLGGLLALVSVLKFIQYIKIRSKRKI